MTGRGRPLRFLALVAAGWIGVRIAILWPQTGSLPAAIETLVPLAQASRPAPADAVLLQAAHVAVERRHARPVARVHDRKPQPDLAASRPAADPARIQMALLGLIQYGAPEFPGTPVVALPTAAQPVTITPMLSRWSASAWLVARPGKGLGAAPGASQLGGSQAGLRVSYLLAPERRVAAFVRVAAPLAGRGAEGAVGLEWQPTRAPVRLVAEQRFGLDGTRGGTGLGVIAGIDTRVPADFRLEAYGQAGAIRRARIEPYADGAARATRVVAERGGVRLSLGAGAWGAAQRDAQRLDLGPSATLGLPLGRQNVRLALDWRQRVAGDARPGSGPALTIGSDF
ncbi:hypothetical protein IAG41_18605 [Sphingomonas sp. JC676]|uniref:hypothetical protein n=1 Tax=Sphingomonas sp. JC676 TaxID=2768065 RepID=UPI001658637F|nr:hypothetical protein [Sphingomonas sp. JC676]MBC9034404.1 hypothetical protein [Sphingomonas sp. JC676]